MDIENILCDYIEYCESKNKSENTIRSYVNHINEFFNFIQKKDLKGIDKKDVYKYLHYIAKEKKNSIATQRNKIAALKNFYSYLVEFELVENNIVHDIETPKMNPPIRKYLTLDQVFKVINSIDSRNKIRDQTILMLFLTTGMRLSEVVNLNIGDIKQNFIIINGKGNKERVVYLTENMREQLHQYLLVRPEAKTSALFVSEQGNRISPNAIRYIVNTILDNAQLGIDLDGITVHTLRHTFATINYQSGNMDLRELQEALGHSNINTTQIYTHMSENQLMKSAENNPLNKLLKNSKKNT